MSLAWPSPDWLKPTPDSEAAENLRKGHSPWVDAIHLLWSIWVFFGPLFDGTGFDRTWVVTTLITYPIFLALFALCIVKPRATTYRYAWAIALLGWLTVPWNGNTACCYFIYGCVMIRACHVSWKVYLLHLISMIAIFIAVATSYDLPWKVQLYLIIMVLIISGVINVGRQAAIKDAALKLSQDEVRRLAAMAERERIGRDLHDLLGHTLSLITLKLELSRKLFDRDAEAARRELEDAEKVARHALAEVRSAVTGIRATDLAAELASARLLLESSAVHLDYDTLPASMPADVERNLALVIREAVTNIHRHAGATEASVRFDTWADKLDMHISDNGRGGISNDGNGISGMRERVRAIGGSLTIDSPSGRGTRVNITVPLKARSNSETTTQVTKPIPLIRGAA